MLLAVALKFVSSDPSEFTRASRVCVLSVHQGEVAAGINIFPSACTWRLNKPGIVRTRRETCVERPVPVEPPQIGAVLTIDA